MTDQEAIDQVLAYIENLDPDPESGPHWHQHLVDIRDILLAPIVETLINISLRRK